MYEKIYSKIKKITLLILVTSMFSIILFSFIPLVANTLYPDSPDFNRLFPIELQKDVVKDGETYTFIALYTHHSLYERSNNYEKYGLTENNDISNLSSQTILINNCYWIVFIISLLAYIGLTMGAAQKLIVLSRLFLSIGCIVILFNFLTIYLHIRFINTANSFENISLANIVSEEFPVAYLYLTLAVTIISLFASLAYTVYVLPSVVHLKKSAKKQPFDDLETPLKPEKLDKEPLIKKTPLIQLQPIFREKSILAKAKKREEIKEQWLKEQQIQQNIRKTYATSEIKSINQEQEVDNPIQKIPQKETGIKPSTEIHQELFESNKQIEEKIEFETITSSEKIQPPVKDLFETIEEKPVQQETDKTIENNQGQKFEKQIQEKPVEKAKSEIPDSKKYIATPFRSQREHHQPIEKTPQKLLTKDDSPKSFEDTLFSAIDKKKKERKK